MPQLVVPLQDSPKQPRTAVATGRSLLSVKSLWCTPPENPQHIRPFYPALTLDAMRQLVTQNHTLGCRGRQHFTH